MSDLRLCLHLSPYVSISLLPCVRPLTMSTSLSLCLNLPINTCQTSEYVYISFHLLTHVRPLTMSTSLSLLPHVRPQTMSTSLSLCLNLPITTCQTSDYVYISLPMSQSPYYHMSIYLTSLMQHDNICQVIKY